MVRIPGIRYVAVLISIFICFQSFAQQSVTSISGSIKDAQTKMPLPGASVYIDQTTIGTTATDSGTFALNVPPGNYSLIVSYVGYKPFSTSLAELDSGKIVVELMPETRMLNEIAIVADTNWKEYFSLFGGFFLGKNVTQCQILNPEVMRFNFTKDTYILTAEASRPLVVENRALGYRIYYELTSFMHYAGRTSYSGFTRYEEMKAANSKEQKRWNSNRLQSYLGSSNHFMYALVNHQTEEEGFVIKKLERTSQPPKQFNVFQKWKGDEYKVAVPLDSLVTPTDQANIFRFSFDNSLFITYKKKKTSINLWGYGKLSQPLFVTSIITILAPDIFLDSNGNLTSPNDLLYAGYWATLRVGDQVPFNYAPEPANKKKK